MSQHMQNAKKKPHLFLLIVLISIGTIAAQFYITAIPAMMDYFSIGLSEVSWTMTIYLIGYAVGQLVYGPLGNFFGRKGGFTIGVLSTFLASILCIAAIIFTKYWAMLLGRFIMAVGASSGLSLTMTVIKDCYSGKEARRITSLAISAFSILPGVVIALNGTLSHIYGWESCFYFMALYCIFVLLVLQYLPETKTKTQDIPYLTGYKKALASRSLWLCSLIMGCSTAGIYLFSTYAPSIAMQFYNYNQAEFGYVNFVPNLALFLGVMFSAMYAEKISGRSMLVIGATLYFLGAVLLIILFKTFDESFWGLLAATTIIFLGIPIIYSNAAVLSGAEIQDTANASAVMSALNLCLGSAAVFATSPWRGLLHIALPIEYITFAIVIILLLVLSNNFARLEKE